MFEVCVNAIEAVDCARAGHPAAYSAYSPATLGTQAAKYTDSTHIQQNSNNNTKMDTQIMGNAKTQCNIYINKMGSTFK